MFGVIPPSKMLKRGEKNEYEENLNFWCCYMNSKYDIRFVDLWLAFQLGLHTAAKYMERSSRNDEYRKYNRREFNRTF